ncbi:fatty acyl-CoA reductase wat [Halyomorpha halys]|uniref:fatty acyl-CoA reductase wat n=1 Tax=Halyomorpha halys TaxID=286706 RepID=UPI0006D4F7D2|nr:fatty acyl-CoA reductase wat [Halyomorpha halys]
MEPQKGSSEICEFYKDKHVLLTGATGLLGKLIIEKLLRVCKPAMIYLIIRTKKSKDPHHRLKELTESKLFHSLKKEDPVFMERLKIVLGDVSELGLGLTSPDAEHLMEKVQVVFHGAATVKFDEPLSTATKINVRGTQAILQLCKKMKNLESVVHISTAYSHCPRKEIREEFYDTPISSEGLISLADNLSPELLNVMTPFIIGKWNNTYVFTKAVAEENISKNGVGLPLSIMRPGIILTTRSEPIPNWVDHIYGPIGMTAGSYAGVIRVIKLNKDDKGELIPADMTVNCLLAVGYKTAKCRRLQEIPIYNMTSHPQNRVKWSDMFYLPQERATEIPYSQTYWHYSSVFNVKSSFNYYLLAFFLHILPAVVIDISLIILQKKPRVLQMYNKIHNSMDLVGYFSTKTWTFSMDNTIDLWKSLNDKDKELFDFDMELLDYKSFLKGTIDGIRIYLLKDEDNDMTYRKKRYFVIYVVDRIARFIMVSGLLWCLWRVFTAIQD